MDIQLLAKNALNAIQLNAPAILTGTAVAGVLGTAALTHRAAFFSGLQVSKDVVAKNIAAMDEDPNSDGVPDPSGMEIFKLTWKNYIPAVLMAGGTIACIVGSQVVNHNRQVALAGAVTLGQAALTEYREKAEEALGKEKTKKVQEAIAQDRVDKNPPSEKQIHLTNDEEMLVQDMLTGRYFTSTLHDLKMAEVDINNQINNEFYVSQNEWYDMIGLDRIPTGDRMGWNGENPLRIMESAVFHKGKPIMAIDYRFLPIPGFQTIDG